MPLSHSAHTSLVNTPPFCRVCHTAQGIASAVTRSSVLPALHVVTAILLAALMGAFNTQVYLDYNAQ